MSLLARLQPFLSKPFLDRDAEAEFQREFRRRSYAIAIPVLFIAAIAATILVWFSYLGYGPSLPTKDIPLRLALAWIAPIMLLVLRNKAERWYPWIVSASLMLSLGQYAFIALASIGEPLSQERYHQLQIRTALVTFYITALVQLPFAFARVLVLANYAVFLTILVVARQQDAPYVLTRIGVVVLLGLFVAWAIENRERHLFASHKELGQQKDELGVQHGLLRAAHEELELR